MSHSQVILTSGHILMYTVNKSIQLAEYTVNKSIQLAEYTVNKPIQLLSIHKLGEFEVSIPPSDVTV